jgi:hypothetical protein
MLLPNPFANVTQLGYFMGYRPTNQLQFLQQQAAHQLQMIQPNGVHTEMMMQSNMNVCYNQKLLATRSIGGRGILQHYCH